jgi:carbamoyl-phosphate synthase large subunit
MWGRFDAYVLMIGGSPNATRLAEDRFLFKEAMHEIGIETPRSGIAKSLPEAMEIAESIGYPLILRHSLTLGGTGGGIAYDTQEFEEGATRAP